MEKLLRVKVHPDSKDDRLEQTGPAAFVAWVRAEAERGLANAAVLGLLAQRLGVEAKRLRIVKGATAPSKIVAILGD
ncbi:MAG TPA: hypothetical protein DEB40_07670 [Elusimicrobia bacterium]|nr:hypothetical protein [Elusimicrobiota bacterium]HBT61606.1 hypothetical protein [Elusimicrobiota bacterium]